MGRTTDTASEVIGGGDPWKNLAAAIVLQAVKDYRNAREYIRIHEHSKNAGVIKRLAVARKDIEDIEEFLTDEQFICLLTNIDGKKIFRKIKDDEDRKEGSRYGKF